MGVLPYFGPMSRIGGERVTLGDQTFLANRLRLLQMEAHSHNPKVNYMSPHDIPVGTTLKTGPSHHFRRGKLYPNFKKLLTIKPNFNLKTSILGVKTYF